MKKLGLIVAFLSALWAAPSEASHYKFAWDATVGAAGYHVYECVPGNCSQSSGKLIADVAATVLEVTPAHPTTVNSCYFVRAIDSTTVEGPASNVYCTSRLGLSAPGNARLVLILTVQPVGGFAVTVTGDTSANVSWAVPVIPVGMALKEYRLERCTGASCTTWALIAAVQHPLVVYTDESLTAATTYRYRVITVDTANNVSAPTSPIQITTTSTDTTNPSDVSGLSCPTVTLATIACSWSVATDNVAVAYYEVERCTGGGCSSWAVVATPSVSSVTHTGLANGITYRTRIKAVDTSGNRSTNYSAIVDATTTAPDTTAPSVPANLTGSVVSTSQINLNWDDSTDGGSGIASYQIEGCSGSASCTGFALMTTSTVSAFNMANLSPGTTYAFRVKAVDNAGNVSGPSNVYSAATQTASGNLVDPATVIPNMTAQNGVVFNPYSLWLEELRKFGKLVCDTDKGLRPGTIKMHDWDGALTWYRLRDYIGQDTWAGITMKQCGDIMAVDFRDTQFGAYSGGVPTQGPAGWNNYTAGVAEHGDRNNNQASINAVIISGTTQMCSGVHDAGNASILGTRENGLCAQAPLYNEALNGQPHDPNLDVRIQNIFTHMTTNFIRNADGTVSQGPGFQGVDYDGDGIKEIGMQPFMVGFEMEVLIDAYTMSTAIPMSIKNQIQTYVKLGLDGLWNLAWRPTYGGFCYISSQYHGGCGNSLASVFPGLNNMIAHAYAWYAKTFPGDVQSPSYKANGLEIWRQGVHRNWCYDAYLNQTGVPYGCQGGVNNNGVYLDSQKFFNQQFRLSVRFILDYMYPNLPLIPAQ